MNKHLKILKRIWLLNFLRRLFIASQYYNKKYFQILKWGFYSREDTNFTYHLKDINIEYLAHSISIVTKCKHSDVVKHIYEIQKDKQLKATVLNAIKNSSEKYYTDNEVRFARRLGWYAIARIIKPRIIVETGVDKGLGSVLLCAALLKNKREGYDGKYYGTDINPKAGYFLQGKYREVGKILYGDSIESLANFKKKIDLFINDSDHSSEYEYKEYQTIKSLIRDNTIILGDNSHCTNKLSQFSLENNRKFIFFQEYPLNHWYPGSGIGISYI